MLKSEINHMYEMSTAIVLQCNRLKLHKKDYICQNCPTIVLVSDQKFWSMLHSHEFQSQSMTKFCLTNLLTNRLCLANNMSWQ